MKKKLKPVSKRKPAAKPQGKQRVALPEPVRVRFADLNPAPYNPRRITPERMRRLKKLLRKHGLVMNLVVQKRSEAHGSMVIIGGHQRREAVRQICAEDGVDPPEHVWAVVLDVDDRTAKQLNIALNNPEAEGEFDPYLLGEVLSQIGELGSSVADAVGFDEAQIEELLKLARSPDEIAAELEQGIGELTGFAKSVTLTVEFLTVEERDEAKSLLKAAATAEKAKGGTVVLRCLKADKLSGRRRANGAVARA